MSVDGIQAASYIGRCERLGRPIKSALAHCRLFRPIDLYARARAEGHDVAPSKKEQKYLSELALTNKLSSLRSDLDRLARERPHEIALNDISLTLTSRRLLREQEIVAHTNRYERCCGVYFLVENGAVVYVGQSVNVPSRVDQHRKQKKFDAYAWVRCDEAHLDALESLYIHVLRPNLNGTGDNSMAPISLERLLSAFDPNASSDRVPR